MCVFVVVALSRMSHFWNIFLLKSAYFKLIYSFHFVNVLDPIGESDFTIFMTDYETYAGIFTCQKVTFAHRQSATLLSRTRDLDKVYVDKVSVSLFFFFDFVFE